MRAAYIDKPLSIVFRDDIPEPTLVDANHVKIKTVVTGICGSEVHAYHGTHPFRIPPVVSGHEVGGIVVEVGANVSRFKVGDNVIVEPHYGCGECEWCKEGKYNICPQKKVLGSGGWVGSFGEFFVAPEKTVIKMPSKLSFEEGALVEVLAVGAHAVRISKLTEGKTALIIGAGPIGLGVFMAAKLAGATKIIMTDALDYNIQIAKQIGCSHVFNPLKEDVIEKIMSLTDGKGVDVTFLAFGSEGTFKDALNLTKRGGEIVQIAIVGREININLSNLQMREINLLGSNMYTIEDFNTIIDAINAGKIDVSPLISKVMPVEECAKAMEIVDKKTENVIKVMLKF